MLIVVGLLVLAKGADVFVAGAARLAVTLKVSPVVVGAVVLGFGTSAPEWLVSALAAARGSLDIAMGNAVGSNLANVTLVLGIAGIIARPHPVPRVVRLEAPLALGSVVLLAVVLQGDGVSRWEAAALIAGLAGALVLMLRASEPPAEPPSEADAEYLAEFEERLEHGPLKGAGTPEGSAKGDAGRVVVGLVATVAGAQLLVVGAQRIVAEIGLTGGFVGLTLVAVGTSLPELVTSIQSARRNEMALLAGNVLGSNVFNSTIVAGTAGLIGPGPIDDTGLTLVATGAMVGAGALAWLFLGKFGKGLQRWEGIALLVAYAATLYLIR